MSSETDFLNGALGKAGVKRIASLDDNTVEANWCKVYYAPTRRGLLGMANWSFAETRLQLNLDATAPLFGFTYAYALPPTIVKFKTYNGIEVNVLMAVDWQEWRFFQPSWKIEGKFLFSNDASAFIEYVRDSENPSEWPPLFYNCMQAWLGSHLAQAIRHDDKKAQELLNEAVGMWQPLALAVDGQNAAVQAYVSDDLTWGRRNP